MGWVEGWSGTVLFSDSNESGLRVGIQFAWIYRALLT